ncbi:MAG: ADOP family duplicated permease [Bryobacteraceae bacterium]|nr:ADOP family duplicated permease [Bryobacteraceae bacterium]
MFRQAFRQLAKSPAFFTICVLTLALGIGLSTTVFSVVDGVLLRPLRFPDADRLVSVGTRFVKEGRDHPRLTGGDWLDIEKSTTSLEAWAMPGGGTIGVQVGGQAEFTGVSLVRGEYGRVFTLAPLAGRWFGADEKTPVAVVSEGFAQRHFGGFEKAVGRTVTVENQVYEISGVVARGYPATANVWLSQAKVQGQPNRNAYNYRLVAKLRPGVSLAQAQAELTALGARLAAAIPENRDKSFYVTPLQAQMVGRAGTMLWLLLGAVGLVLLIACANVANLLLARAGARAAEFAVRTAVGASRAQLMRQLLTECTVIGLAAAAVAFVGAQFGVQAMSRLAANALPRWEEVQVDWRIFAFSATVSLVSALLAGLLPAWRASQVDVSRGLQQGGLRGLIGAQTGGFRAALVVAQIALSVGLSISAALLGRSLLQLNRAELGYQPDSVLIMYAHVPAKSDAELQAVQRRTERLYASLAALPGVTAVSAAMGLPAGQYGSNGAYAVEGKNDFVPGVTGLAQAGFRLAQPGYFAALGIPLRQGRDFTFADQFAAEPVAIISESLARQSFAGQDSLGQRLKCGLDRNVWMRIVGIVGDVRSDSPATPPAPELYMPLAQHPVFANEQQVVIRSSVPPTSLIATVRAVSAKLEPLVATRFESFRESVNDSVSAELLRTRLFLLFAAAALLVALAGVYSVTAYLVERRLPEFGLRLALGATSGGVTRLVLQGTGRWLVLGLALGVFLAWVAQRWLASWLFEVAPFDPLSYAVVLTLVPAIALAASWWPAYRAGRADPQQLLR